MIWEYRKIVLNEHHRKSDDIDLLCELGAEVAPSAIVNIGADGCHHSVNSCRLTRFHRRTPLHLKAWGFLIPYRGL